MKLSKSEEKLMEVIWKNEKVFMNEILDAYEEPKPATTTILTLLKRMQEKGFVKYQTFGNSRQYYAVVDKSDYFSKQIKGVIKNYFDNSPAQFASFFTKATTLTTEELKELRDLIDNQIQNLEK